MIYPSIDKLLTIVDSKYKNALAGYLSDNGISDFYLIDTVAKTFILPLYDKDKNIYVCLANTFNKSAALDILNIIYKELYNADNKLSAVLGE